MSGWDIYSIPLESVPPVGSSRPNVAPTKTSLGQTPLFYGARINLSQYAPCNDPAAMDTYIAIPRGVKGQVFVNGFNLGRYWLVGPQQSFYLPGTLLKCNEPNEIVFLEIEPELVNGTMTAVGLAEREWFNRLDVDCEMCV